MTICPFCKKESECPQCDALTAQVGMACEVNNELIAQRDELRYALNRLLDSQSGTALGVIHARDFAREILAKTAPEICQPDITLSTGRVVRHTRLSNGATGADVVGPTPEMTEEEWQEYCRIITKNPNAGVVQVAPRGRWTKD